MLLIPNDQKYLTDDGDGEPDADDPYQLSRGELDNHWSFSPYRLEMGYV